MAITWTGDRVIKMTAVSDAITIRLAVRKIVWTGFTATSDSLILYNNDGDTIYDITAGKTSGFISDNFFDGFWVNGITVHALTAGRIYIYLK